MGAFSIVHWLVFVIVLAIIVARTVAFWKIFPRAGWSGATALLMLVPVLDTVLLWVLAFKTWPSDKR
jgi:hypothetical protein